MKINLDPQLAGRYNEKIAAGRYYPMPADMTTYVRRSFTCDPMGNVLFDHKGVSIHNLIENVFFSFGPPFPRSQLADNIEKFQTRLTSLFSSGTMIFTPIETLHISLFNDVWQKGNPNPSIHPLIVEPKKVKELIQNITDEITKYGPQTVLFKETALFADGAIVALGYPQNFPRGFDNPSSVDLIRECLKLCHPAGKYPDISHTTLGRLLRQISENEHKLLWDEIDNFNISFPQTLVFNNIQAFYEKRYLLTESITLAQINLDTATVDFNQDFLNQ